MKDGKPSDLLKKYVYVLRVKRMFSIIYFRVRSKGHVSLLVLFICLSLQTGITCQYLCFMYSSFYQLSYLVRSVGKFMVCLCHCLVKFAQKGGDESNISFESESEGLFISFSFVLV